jgi:single-strand DNA-binding protein
VLVTGVLRQREWETADGDKRYAYQVDATEVDISLKQVSVKVAKTTTDTSNASADRWDDGKPPP